MSLIPNTHRNLLGVVVCACNHSTVELMGSGAYSLVGSHAKEALCRRRLALLRVTSKAVLWFHAYAFLKEPVFSTCGLISLGPGQRLEAQTWVPALKVAVQVCSTQAGCPPSLHSPSVLVKLFLSSYPELSVLTQGYDPPLSSFITGHPAQMYSLSLLCGGSHCPPHSDFLNCILKLVLKSA